jgi:hypothetical protein
MKTKEVTEDLARTTEELLQVLSAFSPEQFNLAPPGGGWTAGQVGQHLLKASVAASLYGPAKPTTRTPDQYVQRLREQFLDFTTKMDAPKFILPANGIYNRETLLEGLESIDEQIRVAISTLDLTATCLQVPRELGELTRWELIHFHFFHTQRHTHQLKGIYPKVANLTP